MVKTMKITSGVYVRISCGGRASGVVTSSRRCIPQDVRTPTHKEGDQRKFVKFTEGD